MLLIDLYFTRFTGLHFTVHKCHCNRGIKLLYNYIMLSFTVQIHSNESCKSGTRQVSFLERKEKKAAVYMFVYLTFEHKPDHNTGN